MNIKQIVLKARAAVIRWKLRRLELQRRRTVAEFMLAVDYGRHAAQDLYFKRGQYIAIRKAALESTLRQINKEIV
jgi:hypothetical protein